MLRIFLDNEWVEYNYPDLYSTRGYTDTPSTMLTIYNDNRELIEGWYNSGYNWIEPDKQWYPVNNTPYYVQQNIELTLYRIETPTSYPWFIKSGVDYVLENDSFIAVSHLHDTQGITRTPSTITLEEEGEPIVWYNEAENQYWYDDDKEWKPDSPIHIEGGEYITTPPFEFITPNSGEFLTTPPFEFITLQSGEYLTDPPFEITYTEQ